MAELTVFDIDCDAFLKLHRAAKRGDEAARYRLANFWDEYADRELLCFLCNSSECHGDAAHCEPGST